MRNTTALALLACALGSMPVATAHAATLSVSDGAPAPGATITITWADVTAPTVRDWIGVYANGAADSPSIAWVYTSSCTRTPGTTARASGSCTIEVPASAGEYDLRLFANDGYTRIATYDLQVGAETPPSTASITIEGAVTAGATVRVRWRGVTAPTTRDWIGLFLVDAEDRTYSIEWLYTSSCTQTEGTSARAEGSCELRLPGGSGVFDLRLFADDGYTRLARSSSFRIDATPELTISTTRVAPGGAVTVRWNGILATRTDWLGITVPDAPDSPPSITWVYTSSCTQAEGGASASSGTCTMRMPSVPGIYEIRLYANDGWRRLMRSEQILVGNPSTAPAFTVDRFSVHHAIVGRPYEGRISEHARDPNGASTIRYSKASGAAWLRVAEDGTLSGTPGPRDAGSHTVTVRVTDADGRSDTARMDIDVFQPGTARVDDLSVMAFNIWMGASRVHDGDHKAIDAILESGADVVALIENSGDRAERYAEALGWYGYDGSNGVAVLSRYPIVATYSARAGNDYGHGARVRLGDRGVREAVVWSAHLHYTPYGPYSACHEGASIARLMQEEVSSTRVAQIDDILRAMRDQLRHAHDTPVFLAGDLNTPSHLDWTRPAARHNCGYTVQWPVTQAIAAHGLVDSFRAVHRDPARVPGDTWSPIFVEGEPQDRIDYVFYRGDHVRVTGSRVYTRAVETVDGDPTLNTWPSDHAAVVSTFELR